MEPPQESDPEDDGDGDQQNLGGKGQRGQAEGEEGEEEGEEEEEGEGGDGESVDGQAEKVAKRSRRSETTEEASSKKRKGASKGGPSRLVKETLTYNNDARAFAPASPKRRRCLQVKSARATTGGPSRKVATKKPS